MNEEYGQMPQQQKKERKQKDPNTVLLTVIGVATLLVALVGATFAFFSATVSNQSAQSIAVTTAQAPAALQYSTRAPIALTNAIPTATGNGEFTITNPSSNTKSYTYDLTLIVDSNGFAAKTQKNNQLTYQITDVTTSMASGGNKPTLQNYSTVTDMTHATTGQAVVTTQKIAPGETHTYKSTLTFVDDGTPQNELAGGVSFAAHIEASNVVMVN